MKSQKHSTEELKKKNRNDVSKVKIVSRSQSMDDTGNTATITQNPKFFSPTVDYDTMLNKLSDEFVKLWENPSPSPETGLQGFDELSTLGTGSFGRVALVKQTSTGTYFAAKILIKDQIVKTKQINHVHNEKRALAAVRFPFLVHLEFSAKDYEYLYLGLPFINGGDLFTYHRKVRKFNEKQARFYAAQVFMGLEYLHKMHLLYRDLKPENVLMHSNGYIKITDLGFVKKVDTRTLTLCGTPEYLAPEIIQSKPYSISVDWWSFGVLVYEFVAGNSPFSPHNRDVMVMYTKICEGEFKMPAYFSAPLKDLVENLLQVDMSKRFGNLINGEKDIKEHPWFKNVDWFAVLNQEVTPPYVPHITDMEDLSHFEKYPEQKTYVKSKCNRHAEAFAFF